MPAFPNGLAVTFDLETTALDSVRGFILCGVFKPYLGNPVTIRFDEMHDEPGQEANTVKNMLDLLARFPLWITQNGKRFDWPMLKSRAYILGVPCPNVSNLILDTMEVFQHTGFRTSLNFKGKPSANLGMITDFFFPSENEKTLVLPREWTDSFQGKTPEIRRQSLDKIVEHCRADVRMTEKDFEKLILADTRATFKRVV